MSINRGQWGNMSEEELKEKMNEVKSNTIQLFHEFNQSENVKIKWIN
jgi:hypothetical protein